MKYCGPKISDEIESCIPYPSAFPTDNWCGPAIFLSQTKGVLLFLAFYSYGIGENWIG